MVDFPRVKIVDVNGYKVPVAETQHFTGVGDKTERTSNKTPFPVKDEVARADLKAIKKQTEINKSVKVNNLPNDYPDVATKTELEAIKQTQSEVMQKLTETNEALASVIKDG